MIALSLLLGLLVSGKAQTDGADWPAYGRDPGGSRYLPLAQIDRSNVKTLRVAWTYRTREDVSKSVVGNKAAFEATPIVVRKDLGQSGHVEQHPQVGTEPRQMQVAFGLLQQLVAADEHADQVRADVAHVFHVDQHVPWARRTIGVKPVLQVLRRFRVQFSREREHGDVAGRLRFHSHSLLSVHRSAVGYSHRGVKTGG
jgi:hypothetical protein